MSWKVEQIHFFLMFSSYKITEKSIFLQLLEGCGLIDTKQSNEEADSVDSKHWGPIWIGWQDLLEQGTLSERGILIAHSKHN